MFYINNIRHLETLCNATFFINLVQRLFSNELFFFLFSGKQFNGLRLGLIAWVKLLVITWVELVEQNLKSGVKNKNAEDLSLVLLDSGSYKWVLGCRKFKGFYSNRTTGYTNRKLYGPLDDLIHHLAPMNTLLNRLKN